MAKPKYYSPENILQKKALYNVIFGERSNGKTYSILKIIVQNYAKNKGQGAIIRRWDEDIKGGKGDQIFAPLVNNDEIKKATRGKWDHVSHRGAKFHFARWEMKEKKNGEEEMVEAIDKTPFCYAFALNLEEHYKSTSYPKVTTILFDEFLTRKQYLIDEFITFQNVLSTIIRLRDDVIIFLCGNTINRYCPYFREMGLSHVPSMKKGEIELYEYGDSGLTVAVEYADFPSKAKKSNKYFAFDNPKLKMITSGSWEIAIYPHLPPEMRYRPKDIRYQYFVVFNEEILHCEIVNVGKNWITFVHRKTTDIKDEGKYLVYQEDYDPRPNYRRRITKAVTEIEKKIVSFFVMDKVFYQDNEVGEIMRNYIAWSSKA